MKRIEKSLGSTLKQLREDSGLSQEKLASKAGLDRTYISLLERDRRQPTVRTIFSIAKAIGIKPSELISKIEK